MVRAMRIGTNNIQFFSLIDKDIIFTIWEEEYDVVIGAINESRRYKKEQRELEKKYDEFR
jgi:hypothetical protein